MRGPKPDSVTMYMHIIGILLIKDETTEFETIWNIYVIGKQKTTQLCVVFCFPSFKCYTMNYDSSST